MSPGLRQLRYFVAVAEELHFTRAAQRLQMTQQPLSAAIRRLERDLGVELLRRTTRHVELTGAGAALLDRARPAIAAVEAAFESARVVGRGEAGELVLGSSVGAWYGLEPLFDAVKERCPRLALGVRHESSRMLVDDVRAGRLDAAIGFCTDVPDDLDGRRLKDVPVVAVLAAEHPLAAREIVALAELRGDTFVLADEDDSPGYNAAVRGLCRGAGFEPATQRARADLGAWEDTILRGGCVGLTGRSALQTTRAGVRAIPLEPAATFAVDLLWQPMAPVERPPLATFLALATTVACEQGWLEHER